MSEPITWTDETRRLRDLKPQEDNPREIKRDQAERLVKSWHKFGQPDVISINPDNTILNGHQRYHVWGAAYGMDFEVAVRVASRQFTRREWQEYTVVSHEGAVGGWNWEGLAEWEGVGVEDLVGWGFDEATLLGAGFEFDEGNDEPPPLAQMDKADELQEKWQVKVGDLWEIGRHRLVCGDCTDGAVVSRVMGGQRAQLVVTDPPYNCASDGRNYAANAMKAYTDLRDAEWDKDFDPQPMLATLLSSVMAESATVYIFTSHFLFGELIAWAGEWADFHSRCIWVKQNPTPSLSKRHWTWGDELIVYAVRGKHTFNFPHEGHALNWWSVTRRTHEHEHPTEKPAGIIEIPMRHSSNAGDLVFDGFLGSGTTLAVCEQLNRRGRGIEIEPKYCAVTLERLAGMGLEPVRIESNDQ